MKHSLKISMAANIALAVSALWLGLHHRLMPRAPAVYPVAIRALQGVIPTSPPKEERGGVFSPPFHWSQVESSDYRTYIANLRRIGCPEQTIRDLITADVDSLYASRREKLGRTESAKGAGSSTARLLAQQDLKSGLEQLSREEAHTLSTLLGPEGSSLGSDDRRTWPRALRDKPAVMPLVFQDVDAGALNLSSAQAAVIDDVRRAFKDGLGGPGQDPSDPLYRERWQQLQREADDRLKGLLGAQFVQNYELQVLQRQYSTAGQ